MGVLHRALRGAAAGTVATIPMTAVMVLGQRATGYGRLPPEALVENANTVAATDLDLVRPGVPRMEVEWRAAHLLVGAALGVLYAVVFRPITARMPGPVCGLLFGLAVWVASYQGIAPALNLLPPATEDVRARQATNAVAHAVFGGALGLLSGSARPAAE